MWIEYGQSYGQLQHDLARRGESIVGLQVVVTSPGRIGRTYRWLVGDINEASDLSGEEYRLALDWTVVRYRRLVAEADLLEE